MQIFDTKQRSIVQWAPTGDVRIYVCGITPYDSAHLGHIFTFLTYDLLQRRLQDMGFGVTMVRNITDVDEPIYKRAAELGISYTELAETETQSFQEVMRLLNFLQPAHEPLASQYINEMAKAVEKLLESGHAYRLEDDIYFDISTVDGFGRVACFDERLRLGLFKKRGGDPARQGKRSQLDFLLWKGISDVHDLAAWDDGCSLPKGRPGWHIECTVMSHALLGMPFDIHGGGNDLIFPHHEAEFAQAKALYGREPAKHWVHTAPILYSGEKMSKSLGNLIFAKDLLEKYSPNAIRLALMHYHYREGGEWIPELLDEAENFQTKMQDAVRRSSNGSAHTLLDALRAALDDDLDTHAVLHSLAEFVKAKPAHGAGQETAQTAMDLLGLTIGQK